MEPAGTIQLNVFDMPNDYQQAMREAWKRFKTNQQLNPIVPPLIVASSWGIFISIMISNVKSPNCLHRLDNMFEPGGFSCLKLQ